MKGFKQHNRGVFTENFYFFNDDAKATSMREIKLTIESSFENVALIGMAINKLCSIIPLSDVAAYEIELCVVEAVTNAIEYAYEKERGHDVEVVFKLYPKRLVMEVCYKGKPLEQKYLEQKESSSLDFDTNDIESIPERGRGIPIMNKIMDIIDSTRINEKNILTMTKLLKNENRQ